MKRIQTSDRSDAWCNYYIGVIFWISFLTACGLRGWPFHVLNWIGMAAIWWASRLRP